MEKFQQTLCEGYRVTEKLRESIFREEELV